MKNETVAQLGCAGMVAAAALVIGGIGSLFIADATLAERGLTAIGVAVAAFVAAWLLGGDDHRQHVEVVRSVRKKLEDRPGLEDAEFVAQLSDGVDELVLQVRHAIAAYFEVPPEKILPTDELRRDYKYEVLGPSIQHFVIAHVCQARGIEPPDFLIFRSFHSAEVRNIADLHAEVRLIIDGLPPT